MTNERYARLVTVTPDPHPRGAWPGALGLAFTATLCRE